MLEQKISWLEERLLSVIKWDVENKTKRLCWIESNESDVLKVCYYLMKNGYTSSYTYTGRYYFVEVTKSPEPVYGA